MVMAALRWAAALLWLQMQVGYVQAGYLSLNMTTAYQCDSSLVRWSGDAGPYHLLLTPTAFARHGYNVWIDSIPDGTNSYQLPIRLPAGIQFMMTMWGASGIDYAATTDVMTVQAGAVPNITCYLTDQEILNLYSFSFNITSPAASTPPQCSNLSISWPSSLESNVTSDYIPRDLTEWVTELQPRSDEANVDMRISVPVSPALAALDVRDASSSVNDGNTTHPPTMFGIIPLGNSFSIPITYSRQSKYAKYLPESSLSDNPTTRTRQGVTYLNWTADMAKGTRFILVAGIGSQQKWASGGSSAMFTVGQGSTDCIGNGQNDANGDGAPSVTGSSSVEIPTGPTDDTAPPKRSPVTRTVVASVCSIIGTLVIVGIFFLCRRARNRRRRRNEVTVFRGKPKAVDQMTISSDTPLDLIRSRDRDGQPPRLSPLVLGEHGNSSTAISPIDPFSDQHGKQSYTIGPDPGVPSGSGFGPSRSTTFDTLSPVVPRQGTDSRINRTSSHEALLAHGTYTSTPQGHNTGTYNTARGPLTLHDSGTFATDGAEEDVPDLKRATIAFLGTGGAGGGGGGGGAGPSRRHEPGFGSIPAAGGRRRRNQHPRAEGGEDEQELEYMVHRDAGRVVPEENQTVLELPPRYDEVDWEEDGRTGRGTGTGSVAGTPGETDTNINTNTRVDQNAGH